MKILFVFPRFHTNQTGLIRLLLGNNHIVKFISIGKGQTEDYKYIKPIFIGLSSFGEFLNNIFNRNNDIGYKNVKGLPKIIKLYREVISFRPDVIVVRSLSSTYFKVLLPLLFCLRIRVISYTQNPRYAKKYSFFDKMKFLIINKILNIRFYTNVLYRLQDGPIETLKEIKYLNFIPFIIFPDNEPRQIRNNNILKIFVIGKYVAWKNHIAILESLTKLRDVSRVALTIVGDCVNEEQMVYYKFLNDFVHKNQLDSYVKLEVNVPHSQISTYYKSHDLFILFSINEVASVSILEAMSFGLPIICNDLNGTSHYVKNDYNGFIIENNVDKLAESIEYFIENVEKNRIMGLNSYNLISDTFNVNISYKSFSKLLF